MLNRNKRVWLARFLIGLVLVINIQCALAFLAAPDRYAPGFELEGNVGMGMVRGMGILFLMWNVPYIVAFSNPARRYISLYEAAAMQAIGFVGEILLLITFLDGHFIIRSTIARFIVFDGIGLAALLAAIWLVKPFIRVLATPLTGKS